MTVGAGAYCAVPSKESLIIGKNCDLCGRLYVSGEGSIIIGDYSTIRGDSIISSACRIEIGRYAIISNNVSIMDHNSHPTDPQTRIEMCKGGFYGEAWSNVRAEKKAIIIEDNVWICERASILKGVHIGHGSIVASNAVVTKDVPPYSIVAGNPAKIVKYIKGYNDEKE